MRNHQEINNRHRKKMLPKLSILMLLAAILPESMSGPTNATVGIPKSILEKIECAQRDGTLLKHFDPLRKLTKVLHDFTNREVKMIQTAPFMLDQAISEFNSKLMKEVLKINTGSNILISPASIEFAMLMLYYASPVRTETHKELAGALCIKDVEIDGRSFDPGYLGNIYKVHEYFKKHNSGLELANGLFLGPEIPIKPEFLTFLNVFFGASAHSLPNLPSQAIKLINDFVDKRTNGMIQKIVGPDAVNSDTKAIVVNALYHKGVWKYPFNPAKAVEIEFTPFEGQPMDVTAMYQVNKNLRMGQSSQLNAKVLELPYTNRDKMYIVVPDRNTPEALEEAVTKFDVEKVQADLDIQPEGVEVVLPPVKIEFEDDMAHYLNKLGVLSPFNRLYGGQFYNMIDKGQGGIRISSVIQKTTMTINERGSEAAAATAVTECTRGICGNPTLFIVKQPYGFIMVDGKYGMILFTGVVVNPLEQGNPGASL